MGRIKPGIEELLAPGRAVVLGELWTIEDARGSSCCLKLRLYLRPRSIGNRDLGFLSGCRLDLNLGLADVTLNRLAWRLRLLGFWRSLPSLRLNLFSETIEVIALQKLTV